MENCMKLRLLILMIIQAKNGDVVLSRQDLLNNIHQIQAENNIRMSSDLVDKLGCCQLDIEMETGTGKTYVYIKTMFELNKLFMAGRSSSLLCQVSLFVKV